MPGRDRAVALRCRLREPRRADPGLLGAGARVFHFDVGDGHFVPPVTIGPVVLRSIAPLVHAGGTLDCHLMVDDPVHHFEEIAASGGDSVTFHVEVVEDAAVFARAREQGLGAGVAFNPGTPVEEAAAAANLGADLCLCMSIVPGCSGQEFMDEAYARIERLRSLVDCRVQVDGGVKADNVRRVRDAGADLVVGAASSARPTSPRRTTGWYKPFREFGALASPSRRVAAGTPSRPSAQSSSPPARSSARARPRRRTDDTAR